MKHSNIVTGAKLVSVLLPAAIILIGFCVVVPTLGVAAGSSPMPRATNATISDSPTADRFTQLEARLPALEALLAQCRERGIPTTYEAVDYTTIKKFIPWGREDLNGHPDDAVHIATALEQLYQEATTNLQAYLDGTKQALAAPEYVTHRPRIDGYSFLDDMRWPDGRIEHDRPVFYVGYGFDYNVISAIPDFAGYGNNIVQIDLFGPGNVVYKAGALDWPTCKSEGDEAKVLFAVDTAVAHAGTRSLRITNQGTNAKPFGEASLPLYMEPHSTYQVTAWVKGNNVHNASLRTGTYNGEGCGFGGAETVQPIPDGTYEWQQVTFTISTGDDFLRALRIQTTGPTDQLWIDDLRVTKQGSEENLIPDPGFETIPLYTASGYYASETDLRAELLPLLKLAALHNVAVNLLVNGNPRPSPTLINNTKDPYDVSFALFLHTLIPLIKGNPALHSICLTNEPLYWSDGDESDGPAWQAYLRHMYGDIAHLNAVYRTHYATFTDVPVGADKRKKPAPAPGTGEAARLFDWITFNDAQFARYHRWMADIIHQMAPDIPIHAKIQVVPATDGIDPADFAEFCQISGSDANDSWWYDLQGSLRVAPIFNSEDHLLQGGMTAAQVRTALWQGAIHGRNASTIWLWQRHAEDNLLQEPEVVATIGRTALDLNRLAPEVTAVHQAPTTVAVFHAPLLVSLGTEQWLTSDVYAHGQRPELLTDKLIAAGKLRQYKLVLIPAGAPVARTTLSALARFVDAGGRIITIGDEFEDPVLLWDNHDQLLPAELRAHVLAKAVEGFTLKNDKPESASMAQQLDALTRVHVIDAVTGQPFVYDLRSDLSQEVEWESVNDRGRWLVNVIVRAPGGRAVSLEIDGQKVERVKNLISGESLVGPVFHLDGLTPYLFELSPVAKGAPHGHT